MSKAAERCLMQHLIDASAIQVIVEEGFASSLLPTEDFRPVLEWALRYHYESGGDHAPSLTAFEEEWTLDWFLDRDVDLTDAPEDTVEWAIETLRDSHVQQVGQRFAKEFAIGLSESQVGERVGVFTEAADWLIQTINDLSRRTVRVDMREGLDQRLLAYEDRQERGKTFAGLRFGLDEIDAHTRGIHPGELAVLAAPPKTGKSFMADYVALHEWKRGRPVALFTLENSVDMTQDRIACLATGVDPERWEKGECHSVEVDAVREFRDTMAKHDTPLWVAQPERDRRTIAHLVREAVNHGVVSIIIDQLTFIHVEQMNRRRDLDIRDVLHDLKEMIASPGSLMSCLLVHQINREGVTMARKLGYLLMEHMAESAEVERTADFVFGLHQSEVERNVNLMKFLILASRRTTIKNWELAWNIGQGSIRVKRPLTLDEY